jgi:hypothetical protein
MQRILVQPPSSKEFKLSKKSALDEITVAPGMFMDLEIEFMAPSMKRACFKDKLLIQIINGHNITIPLIANPTKPELKFEKLIDFGVVILPSRNNLPHKNEVRTVSIRNVGKADAKFYVKSENNSFCKIFKGNDQVLSEKEQIFIQSGGACNLTLELDTKIEGSYEEYISIILTDEQEELDSVSTLKFLVKAVFAHHMVQLYNQEGSNDIGLTHFDFGMLYYSQKTKISAIIKNKTGKSLKWAITHSGESSPIVITTKMHQLEKDLVIQHQREKEDAENKASVSVTPAEGVLGPFENNSVTFVFNPKIESPICGFKTKKETMPDRHFNVPMQLRVTDGSDTSEISTEQTIEIMMEGRASCIDALFDNKDILFNNVINGVMTETDSYVKIYNRNQHLGFYFQFESIANFHVTPEDGYLEPLKEKRLRIVFKPSQLGNFSTKLDCRLFIKDGKSSTDRKVIKTLTIILNGTCTPGNHSKLQNTGSMEQFRNKEWESKTKNKHLYWEYLKSSRTNRLHRDRLKYFGDDGITLDYKSLLAEHSQLNIDHESGLTPPEPLDLESNVSIYKILDHSASPFKQNEKQIKALFDQLLGPLQNKQKSKISAPLASHHNSLSGTELSNIFVSSRVLVFEDITLHSTNTLPLNFLCLADTVGPIHISLAFENDGFDLHALDEVAHTMTLSSSSLLLDPMVVSGVEVKITPHKVGPIEQKLTYIINGRYKYKVFVHASVKPVDLKFEVPEVVRFDSLQTHCDKEMKLNSDVPAENGEEIVKSFTANTILRKMYSIENTTSFPASFRWSFLENNDANSISESKEIEDGYFQIIPSSGCGKIKTKLIYYS